MMNEDPLPPGSEAPGPQQSAIRVVWNVFFYLLVVPGAIVVAIKWLFGA